MVGQYEMLSYPFCDKGRIDCLHFPSVVSVKRNRSRVLKGSQKVKSSDVWIIKSGCSVCGKSQEEVEKKLKQDEII